MPSEANAASPQHARPVTRRAGAGVVSAVVCSCGAATIDLVAVPRADPAVLGGVLLAIGVTQLGVAGIVLLRRTRRWSLTAATVSTFVVLYWALTRTSGLLFGAGVWVAQDRRAGSVDIGAALLSLLAAALYIGDGLRRTRTQGGHHVAITALATMPALLISASVTVLGVLLIENAAGPAPAVVELQAPRGQKITSAYCQRDGTRLAMDVYEPASSPELMAPAVLYIHGGVWLYGDRSSDGAYFDQLQTSLTERGFVVASIDYSLGALYPFPAQIEDPKCAVRFLRAHATQLGIDGSRIAAWGSSSGGTSATLLAMTGTPLAWESAEYSDQSRRVQAVVDMSGPTDYAAQAAQYVGFSQVLGKLVGLSLFREPGSIQAASPVNYAPPDDIPFLIVHGTRDFVVPSSQSEALAHRLQSAGTPVRLVLVDGASHVGVDPRMASEIPDAVEFLWTSLRATDQM